MTRRRRASGSNLWQCHRTVADAEQVIEQQQVLRIRRREVEAYLAARRVAVEIANTGDCAQETGHRVERDTAGMRLADGFEHLDTTLGCCRRNVTHQTGLSNTCLTHHPSTPPWSVMARSNKTLDG